MSEHVETETGTVGDAERPHLANAIAACRIYGAKLLVAKLDRLSRDAHWLLGLAKRGIDFVCADNPDVNRMTIGILASVAEHERGLISERTKAALAASKARRNAENRKPLGNPQNLSNQAVGRSNGAAANRARSVGRATDLKAILDELRAAGAISLRDTATGLNERRIPAARGGRWSATQVARLLDALR